jgi:hypothetical protein
MSQKGPGSPCCLSSTIVGELAVVYPAGAQLRYLLAGSFAIWSCSH